MEEVYQVVDENGIPVGNFIYTSLQEAIETEEYLTNNQVGFFKVVFHTLKKPKR